MNIKQLSGDPNLPLLSKVGLSTNIEVILKIIRMRL